IGSAVAADVPGVAGIATFASTAAVGRDHRGLRHHDDRSVETDEPAGPTAATAASRRTAAAPACARGHDRTGDHDLAAGDQIDRAAAGAAGTCCAGPLAAVRATTPTAYEGRVHRRGRRAADRAGTVASAGARS